MVASPFINAPKNCLEPLFDNMSSVCDKKMSHANNKNKFIEGRTIC